MRAHRNELAAAHARVAELEAGAEAAELEALEARMALAEADAAG